MPKCVKIRRKKRQVCIGDLDNIIDIQNRSLDDGFDVDEETENFTSVITPWAMVETVKGIFVVDEVNGGEVEASHRFTIRFPDVVITGENWILFKAKRFSILSQESYEERDEFLVLLCVEKGSSAKKAASA